MLALRLSSRDDNAAGEAPLMLLVMFTTLAPFMDAPFMDAPFTEAPFMDAPFPFDPFTSPTSSPTCTPGSALAACERGDGYLGQ